MNIQLEPETWTVAWQNTSSVVVLGMHRSGTSLVAGILHAMGVKMGEVFRLPDEWNSRGYFEDLDWRAVNKWILNTAGGTWYIPPCARDVLRHGERIGAAVDWLVREKSGCPLWGFKDPRTCLTLEAIHPRLPNPCYVYVKRHIDSIVNSLKRRAGGRGYEESDHHWIALTNTYLQRVDSFLANVDSPVFEIQYEELVKREQAELLLERLADFVGIDDPSAIIRGLRTIRFNG